MRRALPGHFTASLSPHAGTYGMGACIPVSCGPCANCGNCSSCGSDTPIASPPPAPPGRVRPVLQATVISHSGFLPGPCPPGMNCIGPIGQELLTRDEVDRLVWDFDEMAWFDPVTGEFYETKYEATGEEYPGRTEISPESEYLEELRDEDNLPTPPFPDAAKSAFKWGLLVLLLIGAKAFR